MLLIPVGKCGGALILQTVQTCTCIAAGSMLPHALLHVAGAQLLLAPVFLGPSVQAELPQVLDVPDGCGHLRHVVPQVVFVPVV